MGDSIKTETAKDSACLNSYEHGYIYVPTEVMVAMQWGLDKS